MTILLNARRPRPIGIDFCPAILHARDRCFQPDSATHRLAMKQNILRSIATRALIVLAVPLTAHATITTYTDRTAFMNALGGASSTTETFDTPMTFAVGDNLYHGVDFRITGSTAGGNSISGGILNGDEFTNTSIDYIFSTPIFALGADFNGARTSSGFNWIINGITTPIFSSSPGTGFFGIISSDPFTLVDVNAGASPNEIYSLDNFTSAVPEPSSLALAALGLTAVSMFVRTRRTRGSAT